MLISEFGFKIVDSKIGPPYYFLNIQAYKPKTQDEECCSQRYKTQYTLDPKV